MKSFCYSPFLIYIKLIITSLKNSIYILIFLRFILRTQLFVFRGLHLP